jgi:hypothetical protein
MNLTFYGTIEKVEVTGSTVALRCVRVFYHADGLLGDDVWIWSICDAAQVAEARLLLGRSVPGFESGEKSLRVWLDEGDESVTITGSRIDKTEGPRSPAEMEQVIGELSKRILRDESEHLALTKSIREVATSIYQQIDRLERRAEFEKQRRPESSNAFTREIEDLGAILKRLEEGNHGITAQRSARVPNC